MGTEQELLARWRARGLFGDTAESAQDAPEIANKTKSIVQLPIWPEPDRAAPNAVLRSALFGVVRKGFRKQMKRDLIASWNGTTIYYTGEQLDQYDEDVWLQAVHLSRLQDLSDQNGVRFTARSFLKAMDRKCSGSASEAFQKSLDRMVANALTIRLGGFEYSGNLIHSFARHESGHYLLRLNPQLKELFDTGYTRLNWETRRALPTDLARWLHGYVQSHRATRRNPHRISVAALSQLCGAERQRVRDFRRDLRNATEALSKAKVVAEWRITEGDALEFSRPGGVK